MSTFQIIVITASIIIGIVAVLIFAGVIPMPCFTSSCTNNQFGGNIVVWGTVSNENIRTLLQDFNQENSDFFRVQYVEKSVDSYEREILSALASGVGPDVIFVNQNMIISAKNNLYPLPFSNFSERQFLDTFVDEGTLFLNNQGVLALPLAIDPMVMYWNKDLFAGAGIASAPQYWEQFLTLPVKITNRDERGNITTSAVALGGLNNVVHLSDIISTFFMQLGDPIVIMQNGVPSVVLGLTNEGLNSAASALRFYADFSNPAKDAYSWNSSLPNSRDVFESGQLAIYFGKASEYRGIKKRNPHLNFDVAVMPQRQNTKTKRSTFGDITGVSVLKNSKNSTTAFRVALALSSTKWGDAFSKAEYLPSARRDVLSQGASDSVLDVFGKSALLSSSWLDPSPADTNTIFSDMIDSVITGDNDTRDAVVRARNQLEVLFK
jgi:ABC-type glycerol-3-phosphate transport system substrate-binding protein